MKNLKRLKLILLKQIYRAYYAFICLFIKPQAKIVLATNRSTVLKGNLAAIAKELEKENTLPYEVYCFHFERSFKGRIHYFVRSFLLLNRLASSSVFIIDDYLLPLYCIKKRKKNQVIQVWHAVGTLKKFGLSVSENQFDVIKPHTNYDWVIVNNEEDRDAYAEAFAIAPEKVLALGVAKLTLIMEKKQILSQKNLLIAPTYRTKNQKDHIKSVENLVEAIHRNVQDWNIILSVHPYMLNQIKIPKSTRIKVLANNELIEDYYSIASLLITDYSATLFEFSYYENPIILYTPDFDDYTKSPGMYIDITKELMLPMCVTTNQVISNIKINSWESNLKSVKKIKTNIFQKNKEKINSNLLFFIKSII